MGSCSTRSMGVRPRVVLMDGKANTTASRQVDFTIE